MTRSRSPSEHSSRSSSSDTTRSSSTASSYNSGRRSSSSHRSITPEQSRNGIDYVSPLAPKERIPRKVEFRMAKDEVPAPPPVPQKTQRVRVSMSDVARERFDAHAAGIALSHTDRSTLLRELPLVASPLGEVPVVDEQLPKDSERAILMRENDLRTIHETLLSTLNIIELVRKIGADGHGSDFPTAAVGYFDILGSIVSGSIMDIIVLRRERFLRSLAVDPKKAMPSYRRLPLAGSTMIHHMRQAVLPELFGKELRDELASGESAISKSVQKLRAQSSKRKKPTTATSPYGKERCVSKHFHSAWSSSTSLEFNLESDLEFPFEQEMGIVKHVQSGRDAGRLADFLLEWRKLSSAPFILEIVQGYRLPFRIRPNLSPPQPSTCRFEPKLSEQLHKLREKGVVETVPAGSEVWISSMFGIPKKEGSVRPIINLRPLNRFLTVPHFKMENLATIRDVVYRGDYCATIDMCDAYFAINIAEDNRNYLAFYWNGSAYRFTCLPFGLATAPYVYTKLMRVVVTHLRARGMRLINYLDDWIFFSENASACEREVTYAAHFFESLGMRINYSKSVMSPTQRIEFLGMEIDTVRGDFIVPGNKLLRVQQEASALIRSRKAPARELAAFLGRVNFVSIASPLSVFRARRLQREVAKMTSPSDNSTFDRAVCINEDLATDLAWFRDCLQNHARYPFIRCSPDISISTDASKQGWGAVCCGKGTGGRWSREESLRHINILELQAAFFGLKSFGSGWRDINVLLELDNTTAIAYLKRCGGTTNETLSELAKDIWDWCTERRIRLLPTHRPGIENSEADRESRSFGREVAEWSLNSQVVEKMFAYYGRPSVDLFASRLNHKLPSYFSLNPDPGATKVDAFAQSWWGTFGFAFPPFALVGRVIRKAIRDRSSIILVAPLWRSQYWFPLLLRHAESLPVRLESKKSPLLVDPSGGVHPLMKQKNFILLAWKISPRSGQRADAISRLSPLSWPVGLKTLDDSTLLH
ncbi:hypothetical protein Q1695_015273 [Nippostrongylus brasiliensis]|nr:hypothetical protein Q1695_015273 [Nippostrongylus brasiliensis]